MKQNLEIDDLIAYQALLDDICSKIHIVEQSKKSSVDLKFYTQKEVTASINDVAESVERMTGMSVQTVQKLFNDPEFPACNYGKSFVVEANALMGFFAQKRDKHNSRYWKNLNN